MYTIKEDVYVTDISEEQSIIFDYNNSMYYSLDNFSKFIWSLIDENDVCNINDIIVSALNKFDVSEDVLRNDVQQFLDSLIKAELVMETNEKK
ncbi:PqqD family protein [Halobacillus amylolyticus]|uniref:PqqD family protein n=1 Tax=Halobacillus amylolyticus TaxID=2932259 RepID=A0ABY4HIG1_9BACI|nr:PqqD family protein [Halobacillus amylolyticus]UOR14187.1 PqqD family protein [Halobacillus amylolyticus]